MKISIITVYNSINAGSFLQAFTLMNILKELGNYEVTFLETKSRKPLRRVLKSSIKYIMLGKFKELFYMWCKWNKYRMLMSNLPTCKMETNSMKNQDIFIIGSDEIWNVSRKEMSQYPIFWGKGIHGKKLIAYAPSINRSSLEQLEELKYPVECLRNFHSIGVRDSHSKNVLEKLTDKTIKCVLDPTLLKDSEYYGQYEVQVAERNHILVYMHQNRLKEEQIKSIKRFAKQKGMKLISINIMLDWCDKSIPTSPFEFLSHFRNASYVITDTFHGTLFSIIYKKQFITYAADNIKVLDVLDKLGLQSRDITNNSNIEEIFGNILNYNDVYEILERERRSSYEFLRDSLRNF